MAPHRANAGKSSIAVIVGSTVVLIAAVVMFVMWPRPVELSSDSYDLSVALYRICNQKSDEGLDSIQEQIDRLQQDGEDESLQAIQAIVDQARTGDWTSALEETREILDDQVQR